MGVEKPVLPKLSPLDAAKASTLSVLVFTKFYQVKNEQGVPLEWRDHRFLFDIYRDWSPRLVCMKAAQIGFSTLAIIKSLWAARNKHIDIVYTLPTQNDVKDFAGGKVNRIIAQNPVFQEYTRDKDSVEQKQVGKNIIYYRGTWTEKAAIMVSSDLNIYDEEDRSKQDVIAQYASRMQASKYQWEWHFSNPSVPGFGVSRYWEMSDKRHWFITCSQCASEQFPSWPESIDPERKVFQCKGCHKELTYDERWKGVWKPTVTLPVAFRGYWIPLLIAPWVTAQQILDYHETKSAEYFSNFVLGQPYVGEGNTVTPDVIFRNLTNVVNDQHAPVVIGCDSGLKKHFVLGNTSGLFHYGVTDTWDTIEGFLRKYDRSIAVIDHLPDLTGPRKLREMYPGRVFLCHYSVDRKTMQFVRFGQNEEAGNVVVDRNRMMQLVIDEFVDRRIPIQGSRSDWQEFYTHWDDLYRTEELDTLGVPRFKWETKTGRDHWCHASLYWRVGMNRYGFGSGEVIRSGVPSIPTAPTLSLSGTISTDLTKKFVFEDSTTLDWRRL